MGNPPPMRVAGYTAAVGFLVIGLVCMGDMETFTSHNCTRRDKLSGGFKITYTEKCHFRRAKEARSCITEYYAKSKYIVLDNALCLESENIKTNKATEYPKEVMDQIYNNMEEIAGEALNQIGPTPMYYYMASIIFILCGMATIIATFNKSLFVTLPLQFITYIVGYNLALFPIYASHSITFISQDFHPCLEHGLPNDYYMDELPYFITKSGILAIFIAAFIHSIMTFLTYTISSRPKFICPKHLPFYILYGISTFVICIIMILTLRHGNIMFQYIDHSVSQPILKFSAIMSITSIILPILQIIVMFILAKKSNNNTPTPSTTPNAII